MPFNREISTDEYLGTFKQSTQDGEKRQRVLSLVDKLYQPNAQGKRAIDVDQWHAAGILRNLHMMTDAPSEGVSSYGLSARASNSATKADRRGKMYTGYQIEPTGSVAYVGGRRSRSNEWTLQDALDQAVGKGNRKHADILIRVVSETESMPTLTQLTLELTDYYGEASKQTPPYSLGYISAWLTRLFIHFKETGRL